MRQQAPTWPRVLAMACFALSCFGLLLYLWLSFGGSVPLKPEGYRFHVEFPEATQLAQQEEVRISGVPVGKVVALRPGRDNRTDATIELKARYAPIPSDARAILRQKTLLGEAYVELTPGTRRPGTALPEQGTLPNANVSPTVELDEIVRLFDAKTRRDFSAWMESQSQAVTGRGQDINFALGNLPGFVDSTNRVLDDLASQRRAVRLLVSDTGAVFAALARRRDQLTGLITNANEVFETTAQRNRELSNAFVVLPVFERESATTLRRLTRFADRTNPLIDQLQPVAGQLTPTLRTVGRLAPQLKGFFRDLGPVIAASRTGLPAVERLLDDLRPTLGRLDPLLRNANPVFAFLGAYRRELTALFANVTAASEGRDAGIRGGPHFLRVAPPVGPEGLAFYPRRLGASRSSAYALPGVFSRLTRGLPVYDSRGCANGNPSPPTASIPPSVLPLIQTLLFRTPGRDIPAPACRLQGAFPGFGTAFPHVTALPPSG